MSKPISKITVRCPHCGAEQLEPELAKSTFCRRCSQYFAVTRATMGAAPPAELAKATDKPRPGYLTTPVSRETREPTDKPTSTTGFAHRLGGMLGTKPKHRAAQCFECNSSHEVSTTATSSTCKTCGAYIDLQDYKINASFSRNIKTRGSVYLGSKGDLSSSKIECSEAILHGKMRGNLTCGGAVTIRVQGKLLGSIDAGPVIVEKGSDVQFSRPMRVASLEVNGKMSGHVASASHITISKSGSLEGDVTATGFTVEKGGLYQGELTIIPRQTVTAEDTSPTVANVTPVEDTLGSALLGGEQGPAHG